MISLLHGNQLGTQARNAGMDKDIVQPEGIYPPYNCGRREGGVDSVKEVLAMVS